MSPPRLTPGREASQPCPSSPEGRGQTGRVFPGECPGAALLGGRSGGGPHRWRSASQTERVPPRPPPAPSRSPIPRPASGLRPGAGLPHTPSRRTRAVTGFCRHRPAARRRGATPAPARASLAGVFSRGERSPAGAHYPSSAGSTPAPAISSAPRPSAWQDATSPRAARRPREEVCHDPVTTRHTPSAPAHRRGARVSSAGRHGAIGSAPLNARDPRVARGVTAASDRRL